MSAACLLLVGMFGSPQDSYAGAVRSGDTPQSNYQMHHKIVLYNPVPQGDAEFSQIGIYHTISPLNGETVAIFNPAGVNGVTSEFSKFSINEGELRSIYPASATMSDTDILSHQQQGDIITTAIGTFVDSFKDDPALRTIYFTSQDLTFGYKKTIANMLASGADIAASVPSPYNSPWYAEQAEEVRPLTEQEKRALRQETRLIFGLISESYKTILLVLLTMGGALYLSFRYLLNKYI